MILDNENENLKVHEWITEYTEKGKLDIVTGYFTIGALAYISKNINEKVSEFRLVLGDIVNVFNEEERPLDLLNENISIEAALKLSSVCQEAVDFLRQDKVIAKTLEPNFCHAKVYLFEPSDNNDRNKYYITGSSNLTEAGIGLKHTNNIEVNLADTGNGSQHQEFVDWFKKLWERKEAHTKKTVRAADGKETKVDFKEYLIKEIEKVFIKYTPREVYYKVLFELFGDQIMDTENDPDLSRQIGRLENSVIYNTLYEFQQKGVLSLIRMLQKYNGAILADAVGLGKTWSALAVMKFFQLQGRELILLCPKKLEYNWRRYKKHQNSRFEKDGFDYFIRFHTDLIGERLDKEQYQAERADTLFTNDKPKLLVIDESHNLRNDKSNRYRFLMEKILQGNEDIKVLLLSATPINTSLNDIRNQFKLLVQENNYGFKENIGVRNLDSLFRRAQTVYNEWRTDAHPSISDFIEALPDTFFKLTDSLLVARTRKMVEGLQEELTFPEKEKPQNLFVTPKKIGNFEDFEELFNHFPPFLSGYQPSFYLQDEIEEDQDILHDERQRDRFLVKMLYILMVKRLESSWYSFYSTIEKIRAHHQNVLDKILLFESKRDGNYEVDEDSRTREVFEDDELQDEMDELSIGKKRKISIAEIDHAGKLEDYKKDLKTDIEYLDNLISNLSRFESKIDKEISSLNPQVSDDDKLEVLIKKIREKQNWGENRSNQKLVIFTVYRDTAEYLFEQLKKRGFAKIALVSGSGSRTSDAEEETKNFEPILERFAPYTKLFREKEWDFRSKLKGLDAFNEWKDWCRNHQNEVCEKLNKPIDILIATDALSEGQNLQDADMVINYDIHWNPVRIIQRMGRIDRLGSPNKKIFGINFWPSDNINTYLNLQNRIEDRMAAMKLAGSEVDQRFSDRFKNMAQDESLDQRMKNRMMKQMEVTFDDLDGEENFGFDNLSLEAFRQDLFEEFNKDKSKYLEMPKGVYTGFTAEKEICKEDGIIALLGYPSKPPKKKEHRYQFLDLIYIDKYGQNVLLNQKEVLNALSQHKNKNRFVPEGIDKGEESAINELVTALRKWLEDQAVETEEQEDGTTRRKMGREALDTLQQLRGGNLKAIETIKKGENLKDKYQLKNFDLIGWFLVSI